MYRSTSWLQVTPASRNSVQAIPALDTEEILDKQPWITGDMTDEQHRTLQEAIKYLELALRGQEIVDKLVSEGVVTADVRAIESYNFVSRTLKLLPGRTPADLDSTVKTVREVIHKLLSDESGEFPIDEADLELARGLFWALSKARSVSLFD